MRATPETVACRLTSKKKAAFCLAAKTQGKNPNDMLENLIDSFLEIHKIKVNAWDDACD